MILIMILFAFLGIMAYNAYGIWQAVQDNNNCLWTHVSCTLFAFMFYMLLLYNYFSARNSMYGDTR